ncbi:MAG: thiazole synthase [bacterium]
MEKIITDNLEIAGVRFSSRLILGTARYPNPQIMLDSLEASGTEMVTLSIRRHEVSNYFGESILSIIREKNFHLLPNTAGCFTAKEAILTAELAREALGTNWIKLEVIGDDETLFPDVVELLKAAEELVQKGFTVLPYCNDDPITCRKLQDIGCSAVMPLASPIGSGAGIRNEYNLRIIRDTIQIPMIVDAGIGTASDAAQAMELGADAVLLNTAISCAEHPAMMARAMKLGVEAGRAAFLAGRIPKLLYAERSSPLTGLIGHA